MTAAPRYAAQALSVEKLWCWVRKHTPVGKLLNIAPDRRCPVNRRSTEANGYSLSQHQIDELFTLSSRDLSKRRQQMSSWEREEVVDALCKEIERRANERFSAPGFNNLAMLILPYFKRNSHSTVTDALQQMEKDAMRSSGGYILHGRLFSSLTIEKGKIFRKELLRRDQDFRDFVDQLIRELSQDGVPSPYMG